MLKTVAYLEARDPARNIHRAYSIAYGQDLFGNWIVETTFGRIGGKGRTIVAVVKDEDEALHTVRKSLKRRESAPKRLGISYKIKIEDINGTTDGTRETGNHPLFGGGQPSA